MVTSGRQQNSHDSNLEDRFQARMQAQCEAIEAYRLEVMRSEYRSLSVEQAAREWIDRFAEEFASRWPDH